jgi:hypothetical protein
MFDFPKIIALQKIDITRFSLFIILLCGAETFILMILKQ